MTGPEPDPPLAIILVQPQLGENIGMAARAMANFGLGELRLVAPRDGWPNEAARGASAGATGLLDRARVFQTTREAIADLRVVLATSARSRGQMKRVQAPDARARAPSTRGPPPAAPRGDLRARAAGGQRAGILFGPERTGLASEDVSLADALVTFPVDPAFASLNLAQAVLLVGYEWRRAAAGQALPFRANPSTPPATREALLGLFDQIEAELDAAGFYFPAGKRAGMTRNLRDMFHRMAPTEQDVRTWRGVVRALAEKERPRKR